MLVLVASILCAAGSALFIAAGYYATTELGVVRNSAFVIWFMLGAIFILLAAGYLPKSAGDE